MNVANFEVGMLAKSKAGHDKGHVYVICKVEEPYVYLADGTNRTLEKLKKKKRKHVQIICIRNELSGIDNLGIRRILKMFDKENGRK